MVKFLSVFHIHIHGNGNCGTEQTSEKCHGPLLYSLHLQQTHLQQLTFLTPTHMVMMYT